MTWTSKNSGSLLLLLAITTVNKIFEQYIDCADIMGVLVHSIKNCRSCNHVP